MEKAEPVEIAIIGAGPGGLSAGIYASRAGFSTVIFEELIPGGQLTSINELENYPGFGGGINGFEIAVAMKNQAERFGVQFVYQKIENIEQSHGQAGFCLKASNGETYRAKSVIIAIGAKPLLLPQLEGKNLEGKGLSFCATCDGNFYRNREVVVVGGGDTACSDCIYLSRICEKVHLVHRREDLKAHFWLSEKVKKLPNVVIHWKSEVDDVLLENDRISGVVITDKERQKPIQIDCAAIFMAIGAAAQTDWLKGFVKLDKQGYIEADADCQTSVKGVFAVGDVRTTPLRQVVTATADGALAAEGAVKFLTS